MKKLVPYGALIVVGWLVYERFQAPDAQPIFRSRWELQGASLPWLGMFVLAGLALVMLAWIYTRLLARWRRSLVRSWGLASVSDRVRVHGWSASDLRWISKDFAQRHELLPTFVAITAEDQMTASLWFPSGVPVGLLLNFVAYLHSPARFEIRFEAQAESLHVIGYVTITAAFRLPDRSLDGRRGLIYAPAREYSPQLVFVAVAPDKFFEFSLRESTWTRRHDPRMSSWVRELWEQEIAGPQI